PTDTVRAILSYKGVLYKNHLAKGVTKGALTQEEADKKFEAWLAEKEEKISTKVSTLSSESEAEKKKRIAAEKAANEKRAEEIAAKNAPVAEEEAAPVVEGEGEVEVKA